MQNVIEGGPAGCEKTNKPLNIPLHEWLLIGCEWNGWRAKVGCGCSLHALNDLERLEGGRYSEGEARLCRHRSIARASDDELMQRCLIVFARSTPADPIERLSEYAAIRSNLKRNCNSLHTCSLLTRYLQLFHRQHQLRRLLSCLCLSSTNQGGVGMLRTRSTSTSVKS